MELKKSCPQIPKEDHTAVETHIQKKITGGDQRAARRPSQCPNTDFFVTPYYESVGTA